MPSLLAFDSPAGDARRVRSTGLARLSQPARHAQPTKKGLRPFALACLASLGLLAAAPACAQSVQYSSLKLKDCPAEKNLRLPDQDVTANAVRCKAPAGWQLFVVDEDPRSYVVLGQGEGKNRRLFSTLTDVQLGQFPNIGETPAEWRLDAAGKPYAFIVRLRFQDNANPEQGRSRLIVYRLDKGPRFVGHYATNEQARAAADAAR